jgi:hypothetical protein
MSFAQDTSAFRRDRLITDTTFYVDIGPNVQRVQCHALIYLLTKEDRSPTVYNFDFSASALPNRKFSVVDTTPSGSGMYTFTDLNFDGYKDLRYDMDMDNHANSIYEQWRFNPDSLLYQRWDGFPDEQGEMELDRTNKTISFSNYTFLAIVRASWTRVYKFFGTTALLIEGHEWNDYSQNEHYSEPDSAKETIDAYKYDSVAGNPILAEHVHADKLTKQGTEFITTILRKRVGDQMIVVNTTHEVKKAE